MPFTCMRLKLLFFLIVCVSCNSGGFPLPVSILLFTRPNGNIVRTNVQNETRIFEFFLICKCIIHRVPISTLCNMKMSLTLILIFGSVKRNMVNGISSFVRVCVYMCNIIHSKIPILWLMVQCWETLRELPNWRARVLLLLRLLPFRYFFVSVYVVNELGLHSYLDVRFIHLKCSVNLTQNA